VSVIQGIQFHFKAIAIGEISDATSKWPSALALTLAQRQKHFFDTPIHLCGRVEVRGADRGSISGTCVCINIHRRMRTRENSCVPLESYAQEYGAEYGESG